MQYIQVSHNNDTSSHTDSWSSRVLKSQEKSTKAIDFPVTHSTKEHELYHGEQMSFTIPYIPRRDPPQVLVIPGFLLL